MLLDLFGADFLLWPPIFTYAHTAYPLSCLQLAQGEPHAPSTTEGIGKE